MDAVAPPFLNEIVSASTSPPFILNLLMSTEVVGELDPHPRFLPYGFPCYPQNQRDKLRGRESQPISFI
jgi:hypothetical protein